MVIEPVHRGSSSILKVTFFGTPCTIPHNYISYTILKSAPLDLGLHNPTPLLLPCRERRLQPFISFREGGEQNAKSCSPLSQLIEALTNSNRMRSKSLQ